MDAGRDGAWTIGASAFNWTPDVIRARREATEIALDIVTDGISTVIELEPGQLWRSFPETSEDEASALRISLAAAGGTVSIVGASLDDWKSPTRRRTDDERLAFLVPQLRVARALGARGVRLPIGQAGPTLTRQVLPHLRDLDLVLFEEAQGGQTPGSAPFAPAYDAIAELDDPHVRLLIDISMLMPALPPTYLERLRAGGIPESLLRRLEDAWRDPATNDAVLDLLRSGGVPGHIHTLYMNLLVRFGRSEVADIRDVLPLTAGFHFKFWDLDDSDLRVSAPIRELAAALAGTDFAGVITSEWGGHEWLDDDPATMTRDHIALAHAALSAGIRAAT